MVSVRKRGKVYEYRIEIASIDGTRKWLTKSGFKTKQEALHEGALVIMNITIMVRRIRIEICHSQII